ncbi:MAG TPA: hypothetical protein VG225_03365, partial [Terracidiphilus sp.]|nr:hypothetical protein [Terracidiphilus sp.]
MSATVQPRPWERLLWPLLASAVFLAFWHYAVLLSQTKIFPSPLEVERGFAELIHQGKLYRDIVDS